MKNLFLVTLSIVLAACAGEPRKDEEAQDKTHTGKIVGATGGGAIGAAWGWSSAGLLCTVGGPLCAIVIVPAAIFGGLIGGAAGSIGDAVKDSQASKERRKASEKSAQPLADTSPRPGG
jgi:hypothetical protein